MTDAFGGGIASMESVGSVTLIDSELRTNSAIGGTATAGSGADGTSASGGGIYFVGGTLTIERSLLFVSSAEGGGGGSGGSGDGGDGGSAFGGALFLAGGTVAISSSSIVASPANGGPGGDGQNSGGAGGVAEGAGIFSAANVTLTNSTIDNAAASGGNGGDAFGVGAGTSHAGGDGGLAVGGAIYALAGIMDLNSVTIFASFTRGGNGGDGGRTDGPGGTHGVGGNAFGGAIASFITVTLTHGTIAQNSATGGDSGVNQPGATAPARDSASGLGGGIGVLADSFSIRNTIVAENTADYGDGAAVLAIDAPDVVGSFTSLGHNLIGDGTGATGFGATGDQIGTSATPIDPLLGPTDGGIFSQALHLLEGSPAIDAGVAAGATSDQRGHARTVDSAAVNAPTSDGTDIGAYERQTGLTADLTVTMTAAPDPVSAGTNIVYTIIVSNLGPGTSIEVELTDVLPAGTTFVSIAAPAGWTVRTPGVGFGGTVSAKIASMLGVTAASFELVVQVDPGAIPGTLITNSVSVGATVHNSNPGNDTDTQSTTVASHDFGDAPDSYGTLLASDGPRHAVGSGLALGVAIDSEGTGVPTAGANGDDLAVSDDEDGVTFPAGGLVAGVTNSVSVVASDPGLLDAWIDFNGNGTFDPAEKIASGLAVSSGTNSVSFSVPANAVASTYARFRISTAGTPLPTGVAADGEVEDYAVSIATAASGVAGLVADPANPGTFVLRVIGTSAPSNGNDTIAVDPLSGNRTQVKLNNKVIGIFNNADFARISVSGLAGNDKITINAKITIPAELNGNDGNDTLTGGAGIDTLRGGEGNDTLYGGKNNDDLFGDAGNDALYGQEGNDTLEGNAGADRGWGEAGNDILRGGTENDSLYGGAGLDTLQGEEGNDVLFGDADIDVLDGGAGNDTMSGGTGNDTMLGGDDDDSMSGGDGEDVMEGSLGNDRVSGDNGNDVLDGGPGNDSLFGGNGNDIITGDLDNDYLSGGAGNDQLNGADGNDTILGEAGNDTIFGGDNDDKISGGDGDDSLLGNEGNDSMSGGNGNDVLQGDSGNDTLLGDAGNDILFGGADTNILSGGAGNDVLRGHDGEDVLNGDGDKDILIGHGGPDKVNGGAGDDLLIGGTTDYDGNIAALKLLIAEWGSSRTYAVRVANIRNGTGPVLAPGGVPTGIKLTPGVETQDDGEINTLTGAAGVDWFLAGALDITDRNAANEQLN